MKAICSECIDVELPVNRVFDFVSDLTHWPLWLTFVVSAQRKGRAHGDLVRDQEVEICMQRGRRRWRELFDVIRIVPNAFLWLEGSLSAARRIEFRFEQRRSGTRVHCSVGYPVYGGALGALRDALFVRRALAHDVQRSLLGLQIALEGGEERMTGSANEPLLA